MPDVKPYAFVHSLRIKAIEPDELASFYGDVFDAPSRKVSEDISQVKLSDSSIEFVRSNVGSSLDIQITVNDLARVVERLQVKEFYVGPVAQHGST